MKQKEMKLAEIKHDDKLLKLRPVNQYIVNRYRQAYRSGADMPLITVDQTGIIYSGNHRFSALVAEYPEDYVIAVNVLPKMSEKDKLKFFADENAKHGHPLDGISKKRISFALVNAGASEEEIAQIFNISVKKVIKWGDEFVMVQQGNNIPEPKPVKYGPEINKDNPIQETTYNEHINQDRGGSALVFANQLIRWLNNGWVAKSEKNIETFAELKNYIDNWLTN